MPSQNPNQFTQSTVQGQTDLTGFGGNVITCQVDAAQGTALVAGQAVKGAVTGGGTPKVLAAAAANDPVFGFVVRNLKDASFPASSMVEIASFGTVVWMTAGGAIARFGSIEIVPGTIKVIANAGVNPVTGMALDKATADGDLIRVLIQTPFAAADAANPNLIQVVKVTATLAEINAGKVLVPAIAGQKITITDYVARVTGAFATGTSIKLQSTNAAPVDATTIAEAALTNGAGLLPASANTTLGTGYAQPLGLGDGLKVVNVGAAQTGGTSIDFTISFSQA